jgi:putative nucleotidyltransferase with HDIG domain
MPAATEFDLTRLARTAPELEPLPMSVTRLACMVADEHTEMTEIAQVIAYDQILTSSLIRTANSADQGARVPVTTVRDAVVRVGTGTVLSVAMAASVGRRMSRPLPQYGLSEGDLWSHSVAAALAAEQMPRFARVRIPPETVTAALLHDLGKLVIARIMTPESIALMTRVHDQLRARLAAEEQVLHTDHARLGGEVATTWGLPPSIARGIAHHHQLPATMNTIPCAVHVADLVAKAVGAGLEDDNRDPETLRYALSQLSIGIDDFGRLCEAVAERFHVVRSRYG